MVNSISILEPTAVNSLGRLDLISHMSYDLIEIIEEDDQFDSSSINSVGSESLFPVDGPKSETEESADEKPDESEAEKPTETEAEKPAEETAESQTLKPAKTEAEKTAEEKPAESEAEKPAESEVRKIAVENPAESQTEKPAETEAGKTAEEKPAESEAEKPAESEVDKQAEEKPAESEVKKPAEKKTAESETEKPVESDVEKPAEEKPAESEAERPVEEEPVIPDLTEEQMKALFDYLTEDPAREVALCDCNYSMKDLQKFLHKDSWMSDNMLDQYLSLSAHLRHNTGTVVFPSDEYSSLQRMLMYGGEKEIGRLLGRWQSYKKILLPVIIKGLVGKVFWVKYHLFLFPILPFKTEFEEVPFFNQNKIPILIKECIGFV